MPCATLPSPLTLAETARLILRQPRIDDAPALSAMMTASVSRWLGAWPLPFTPKMAAERITHVLAAEAEGKALPLVVTRRSDDRVLGWIASSRQDGNADRATLGYWLGEVHHGQGYMREAAPAALARTFAVLPVAAVEASTHPENLASLAVFRACGMRYAEDRMIFAPARLREEFCHVYEALRPV